MRAGDKFSEGPTDNLVLCDLLDAPIIIVREPPQNLVFQTEIVPREDEEQYERPYKRIILRPVEGSVRALRLYSLGGKNFEFNLHSKHPFPHAAFHNIGSYD